LFRHGGIGGIRRLKRFTPNINPQSESNMAKYLISFPSAAMVVPDGEWEAVGRAAHAVIDEAKAAGAYVFGGGIDETVPPVLVSADGAVAEGGYPWAPPLNGGFTVLELPSRDQAVAWAARLAKACRCQQELRVFGFDPQS
jgi:hypothetical protein